MPRPKVGLGRDPFAALEEKRAPVLAEVSLQSEVDLETRTIRLEDIEVDDHFNARTNYDEQEIASLADNIREEGLLNPLTVRYRPHRKPAYFLVAGFKRHRALQRLEVTTAPARVCRVELDAQAYLLNLAENTSGRSDLSAADIAKRCAWLSESYGLSGAQIAEHVKLSKAHVNNLIRVNRQLHPTIAAAFEANHDSAKLQRLVALCSQPADAQLKAWQEMVRLDRRADTHAEPRKDVTKDSDAEEGRVRPTIRVIQKALRRLNSPAAAHLEADWRKGFAEALQWVIGDAEAPSLGVDLSVRRGRPAVHEEAKSSLSEATEDA
jgi:ParB/RepB/Spo0J family partition protein